MISSKLNLMNDKVDVNLTYIITNHIVSSFPRVTLIIYCLFLQIINNQELTHTSSKYLLYSNTNVYSKECVFIYQSFYILLQKSSSSVCYRTKVEMLNLYTFTRIFTIMCDKNDFLFLEKIMKIVK